MGNKRMMSCVLLVLISLFFGESIQLNNIPMSVAAQVNDIEYSYDAVGRLILVTYPNGEQIYYEYDANGNVTSNSVMNVVIKEEEDKEGNVENKKEPIARGMGFSPIGLSARAIGDLHESPQDKQAYKKFQKKKPVIKSIKKLEKKSKRYLKIQVKKISGLGNYIETGYQIKYATNKNFKKAKTLKFNKKGSVTGKNWKVKKGKNYWLKVRAYMKTKTGKIIYSKYSKSVKIKTN